MKNILLLVIIAFVFSNAFAQKQVSTSNIITHMGENVTVSDRIIKVTYNENIKESYLTIGSNQQNLTIVIKANTENKLSDWAKNLPNGQDIRVSGKLYQYKGKPSILVTNASQLKLSLVDNIVKEGFGSF